MATLVYSPAIRVHVRVPTSRLHPHKKIKKGNEWTVLNIGSDITQWQVVRRTNTVSSFNFILQNEDRKYDRIMQPGDAITVSLKRLTWVRVFTGTINSAPLFSAWGRALPMSASCTMKKLQFWPWDPAAQESATLINQVAQTAAGDKSHTDGGLSAMISEMITKITNWPKDQIHIGAIPENWFKWANTFEQTVDAATNMAQVLGGASIGGTSPTDMSFLKLGSFDYGSMGLTAAEKANCVAVYKDVLQYSGVPPTNAEKQDLLAEAVLMAGLCWSAYSDSAAAITVGNQTGWYGMGPNWGQAAERENLNWSTKAVMKGGNTANGILQIKGWEHLGTPNVVKAVLPAVFRSAQNARGGKLNTLTKAQNAAHSMVTDLRDQINKQLANQTAPPGSQTPTAPTGNYLATGDQLAKVAYDMLTGRPPGTIHYTEACRGTYAGQVQNPKPTELDCSQLVAWVYYHTTGQNFPGAPQNGSNTSTEYPVCVKLPDIVDGVKLEDVVKEIRGALPFRHYDGGANGHVGISLGQTVNGGGWGLGNHIAAHTSGVPAPQQVNIDFITFTADNFNTAVLAPHIDYTNAATTQRAANFLSKVLNKKCSVSNYKGIKDIDVTNPDGSGSSSSSGSPDSTNSALLGFLMSPPQIPSLFSGPRLLINNQPFLPWITNLINSSMRAFCSAPDGSLIAWFPDYFNVWDTAAIMKIKPIELQDFTVDWSDQTIVTHEFVIGSIQSTFDQSSGGIVSGNADIPQQMLMLMTNGIATMDFPQIFKAIYNEEASLSFVHEYLTRFGARPVLEQMANIPQGPQEFFMALYLFMLRWSEQFSATVPMTFMPELWPGMIIQIEEYGFQAYVQEVTHQGSYGPGGGFTTSAQIIAPAPIEKKLRSSMFNVLDINQGSTRKKNHSKNTIKGAS